jgi:hypothetical protein
VETLLERAEQMDLYEDEYWRTLLHYKRTPFGTKSLIDDPKSFLAGNSSRPWTGSSREQPR